MIRETEIEKKGTASNDDIVALQRYLGETLPAAIIEFFSQYDGAKPESNIFKVGSKNEAGVNAFIPVREIISEGKSIVSLPRGAFPIAWQKAETMSSLI